MSYRKKVLWSAFSKIFLLRKWFLVMVKMINYYNELMKSAFLANFVPLTYMWLLGHYGCKTEYKTSNYKLRHQTAITFFLDLWILPAPEKPKYLLNFIFHSRKMFNYSRNDKIPFVIIFVISIQNRKILFLHWFS